MKFQLLVQLFHLPNRLRYAAKYQSGDYSRLSIMMGSTQGATVDWGFETLQNCIFLSALLFLKFEWTQAGRDISDGLYNTLLGRKKSPPRWETCVEYLNGGDFKGEWAGGIMPVATGSMFVKRYVKEEDLDSVVEMTTILR